MSDSEGKSLVDRVTGLEESVQSFSTKLEYGGAKADVAGATAAATGVSAEFTGLGTGVKLWSAELDVKAEWEKNRDRNARRDPESLRSELTTARTDITRIRSDMTRVDQRITELSRDLNLKLRRKADLSDLRATASQQRSQLHGLRDSQLSSLRRESQQANANVQMLRAEIDRLNARF
ncbi:hypothetical protein ABZV77_26185 [Streptomyces sp. NPDC004732]|uniref:hypothetical protein n=1 Tax=Streptomyces sp. NPDC004732 TaxID=3154290 RepID=UPI0033A4BB79